MKRVHLAVVVAILGLLISTSPANAGIGWCKTDPIILVEDRLADVFVSAPLDALITVTGPTKFVITVPRGVDATLILKGIGFGRGEVVDIVHSHKLQVRDGRIPIRIAVYVPAARDDLPVMVEFASGLNGLLNPAVAEGTANTWIRLSVRL
jgi:hypothetical protein